MKIAKRFSLVALFGIVATCLSYPAIAQSGSDVIIGVTYDAAKQASYYSLQQKHALELLADDVNAAGGVLGKKISLKFLDDENNPTIAAQRVEQLNSENAVFILQIGSSSTGLTAQQKAQELGIPNGSPGNQNARLTRPNLPSFYFRTGLLDITMAESIIAYIRRVVPDPKVAIVTDTTLQGLTLADVAASALQQAGMPAVAREQISSGSANVTPQALRISSSGANVVMSLSAGLPELVSYAKAHRQVGNKASIVGFSPLGSTDFLRLAGPAAEGVVFPDVVDFERPDVLALNSRLAAKSKDLDLSAFGIYGYEFGRLVVDAIKSSGTLDRGRIRDAMERTKDWPSLLGPSGNVISFSPTNHDGISRGEQLVLRTVKDGKFVTLK